MQVKIKAIFHRKEPQLDLKHCEFNTVVCLPDEKYQRFLKNMTDDYDFVQRRLDELEARIALELYGSEHIGIGSDGEQKLSAPDAYAEVFKKTRLCTQVGRPELIDRINKTSDLKVGWRGDGFGSPRHTRELYPERISKVENNWMIAPVSFESYWWLCEWKRQGWDIDELIEASLGWHITSFNAKSMPIPYEWKDKIDAWVDRMGYHFVIDSAKLPVSAIRGSIVNVELTVDNVGVAPIYHKLPLKARLKNSINEYVFETNADITKWLPGKHVEKLTLKLDDRTRNGEYTLEIAIFNGENTICFATDAKENGGYYEIGKLIIK